MKDDAIFPTLVCVLMIVFGSVIGWLFAHEVVANECRKLEGFYVGNTTFACKAKETK